MATEYDVALSFAGEDRAHADHLAHGLRSNGLKIFFSDWEQSALLGEDLYTYFSDLFQVRARFCVMLVSEHYAKKVWTSHERKAAQARALKTSGAYILPVRLDDTPVPGLLDTVGYIGWPPATADQVVAAISEKVRGAAGNNRKPADARQPEQLELAPHYTLKATPRQFGRHLDYGELEKGRIVPSTTFYQREAYLTDAVDVLWAATKSLDPQAKDRAVRVPPFITAKNLKFWKPRVELELRFAGRGFAVELKQWLEGMNPMNPPSYRVVATILSARRPTADSLLAVYRETGPAAVVTDCDA